MKSLRHWYSISTARCARECEHLASLPYFALERTRTNEREAFTAVGTLSYTGRRSGRTDSFCVRLNYPARFPKQAPTVFDHHQRFTPGLDGHLLSTQEVCLTLPERGEFSLGTETLTTEQLGAALIWFHKRLIFDRTKIWPGPAEPHGINAVIDLLVERHVAHDANSLSGWFLAHASAPAGGPCEPDVYAPCPCENGKKIEVLSPRGLEPHIQADCSISRNFSAIRDSPESNDKGQRTYGRVHSALDRCEQGQP
jgi:hypothetical protein